MSLSGLILGVINIAIVVIVLLLVGALVRCVPIRLTQIPTAYRDAGAFFLRCQAPGATVL